MGWAGGRWGEPAQRGQHDGHRPPWVLGGAVACTVGLTFVTGVGDALCACAAAWSLLGLGSGM